MINIFSTTFSKFDVYVLNFKWLHFTFNLKYISGKTIPQVALRWLIQKDVVASVIIGATSVEQLEDNMGASTGWKLSTGEVYTIAHFISFDNLENDQNVLKVLGSYRCILIFGPIHICVFA